MHRGWMNLRTAITSNDEKAVLEECERGEDHAVKAYREATSKLLPEPSRTIVDRQAGDVLRAHDTMRSMRDIEKASAHQH